VALSVDELRRADAVIIATDHSAFDYQNIVAHSSLVIDTRNATRSVRGEGGKVVRA